MIASLFLACALAPQEDWPGDSSRIGKDAEPFRAVASLTEEISLLNLINGLCLTRAQMERLAALARRAGEVRDAEMKRRAETARELAAALAELRKSLIERDGAIPP
ncbi:MAG: hypothetical protein HYY17_08425 [Planctomycetes bacterium]|nr:hypothetical protein [Planctomycetota bacterium]